jgi:hypothetical protein
MSVLLWLLVGFSLGYVLFVISIVSLVVWLAYHRRG